MHWIVPHIQAEINSLDSVLDLCCGYGLAMKDVACDFYVAVDIDHEQLTRYVASPHPGDSFYIQADVTTLPTDWLAYPFDVAVCADGIEHLTKPLALATLAKMERWARKTIIVTPDRFFTNEINDITGKHQFHKSLITEDEFVALGYEVKLKQPEVLGHNCMMYVKVVR